MRIYHLPRIVALALVLALLAGGYSLMACEKAADCVPGHCPDNVKCANCPMQQSGCCASMGKTGGTATCLKMATGDKKKMSCNHSAAGKTNALNTVKASTTVDCNPSADCAPSSGCCAGATKSASKTTSTAAKVVQGDA